jgi:hypothetical protein
MTVEVTVGQVWADNDERAAGRTVRVDRIDGGYAICMVLTNTNYAQRFLDEPSQNPWLRSTDRRGATTRIALKRFRPATNGYRLVTDAPNNSNERNETA